MFIFIYKILHDLKVKLIAEQKKANKYERVQPSKTNSVFINNKINVVEQEKRFRNQIAYELLRWAEVERALVRNHDRW